MKYIKLLILPLLLSACIIKEPVLVETQKAPVDFRVETKQDLEELKFQVLTIENKDDKFEALISKDGHGAFICLSPKHYERLSRNMLKLKEKLETKDQIIENYHNYLNN